jgi:hypothetical protein
VSRQLLHLREFSVELQNANFWLHAFAIRKSGFQEQLLNLN